MPKDLEVVPLGHRLEERAVECVRHWEFSPGYKDGKPVDTPGVSVRVGFDLGPAGRMEYGLDPCTDKNATPLTPADGSGKSAQPGLDSAFRVGGGVSQPSVICKVDPEYSEEARKAKHSGTVQLELVIDVDGRAKNIKVVKGVGLGLDEKAIEAVRRWRFIPGEKTGQAVPVYATVSVSFATE
jgi:TonB family protein